MNLKSIVQTAKGEVSTISSEVKELSQIHAELLKVEAKELADFIKKKVIVGVVLALFAFFLACVFLTAAIAATGIYIKEMLPVEMQPYSWQLVAASVSLVFLLIIAICALVLKKKPNSPFFSHTKQELQNDRVWLQNLTKQKSKNS